MKRNYDFQEELSSGPFFLQSLLDHVRYLLWFNFILGSNFISCCFKLVIIH